MGFFWTTFDIEGSGCELLGLGLLIVSGFRELSGGRINGRKRGDLGKFLLRGGGGSAGEEEAMKKMRCNVELL